MIDTFVESEFREFVESEFHERDGHAACAAGFSAGQFLMEYESGVHSANSFGPGHPGGYWRFDMTAVIHGPSASDPAFPDFFRSIHMIVARIPNGGGAPLELFDEDGNVHTRQGLGFVAGTGGVDGFTPMSLDHSIDQPPGGGGPPFPPGTIYWHDAMHYYGFGSNFFGPLLGPALFRGFTIVPGVPIGSIGPIGSGFYTWKFPSGGARTENRTVTVRTPTTYCNPRFGLFLYSADTHVDITMTVKRFDRFVVKFIYTQLSPLLILFTDVTILSNDFAIDGGSRTQFWEFSLAVPGWTSTNINPSFVYPAPGEYQVRLTVTDRHGGETHSAIQTITVT